MSDLSLSSTAKMFVHNVVEKMDRTERIDTSGLPGRLCEWVCLQSADNLQSVVSVLLMYLLNYHNL